jgi:hypothetical protein
VPIQGADPDSLDNLGRTLKQQIDTISGVISSVSVGPARRFMIGRNVPFGPANERRLQRPADHPNPRPCAAMGG